MYRLQMAICTSAKMIVASRAVAVAVMAQAMTVLVKQLQALHSCVPLVGVLLVIVDDPPSGPASVSLVEGVAPSSVWRHIRSDTFCILRNFIAKLEEHLAFGGFTAYILVRVFCF